MTKTSQYLIKLILSSIFILFHFISMAAERNDTNTDDQAFSSTLLIQNTYDNNILRSQEEVIEANILIVAPELVFRLGEGLSSYEFIINGEIAKYDGSSENNYEDSSFSTTADFEFTSRHRLNLHVTYADNHDELGAAFTQGLGEFFEEVDTYNQTDFSAVYSFGRTATVGQINFSIDSSDINYDSRFIDGEDYTLGRDHSQITSALEFYYAMTAKIAFQANASYIETAYDVQTGLDSTENNVLVGLTWQGSDKITGSALVGYSDRKSDDGLADEKGSIWQVDLTWMPLTYSSVNFTTSKENQESTGTGNFNIVTVSGISWDHQWKSRFSSSLSVEFQNTKYVGIDIEDDTMSFQAILDYQLRNWLNVQLSYTNTSRDTNSEISLFNFDREIISLSLVFAI